MPYRHARNVVSGQLKLPTQGTDGGILFGGDVLLYRSGANWLSLLAGDSLMMTTTGMIRFRDAGLNISSKDDGHLDLDADVSIDLNGTVNVGESGDSVGFLGKAAVTQQAHEADPTDLATCITAITNIIDKLKAYGLLAADP